MAQTIRRMHPPALKTQKTYRINGTFGFCLHFPVSSSGSCHVSIGCCLDWMWTVAGWDLRQEFLLASIDQLALQILVERLRVYRSPTKEIDSLQEAMVLAYYRLECRNQTTLQDGWTCLTLPSLLSSFMKIPKQLFIFGTNILQAEIIELAEASMALITKSSTCDINKPVSLPSVFRCLKRALRVHLCPTFSALGSSDLKRACVIPTKL